LFFSQPRKRAVAKPPDSAPDLATEEKIELSIAQNVALSFEAKRKQEQNEAEAGQIQNDDDRFTLFERRVVFGFELALTVIFSLALVGLLLIDPRSLGTLLSSIGALGSSFSLLLRKRRDRSGV
jgi:hypothetical protein